LATGKIASSFATNLALLPECRLAAVGARRLESAQSFAASHGVESAYGDYRAVAEDPAVDVVYVATPHALHEEHVRLAFEAGKPVLCEKALTLDAASATRLVTEANERGLFFMEAMWMRCIPMIRRVRELVGSGVLGEVRQVRAIHRHQIIRVRDVVLHLGGDRHRRWRAADRHRPERGGPAVGGRCGRTRLAIGPGRRGLGGPDSRGRTQSGS